MARAQPAWSSPQRIRGFGIVAETLRVRGVFLKLRALMADSFTLFVTPIGTGGIAWNERGVSGLQLPEPDAARLRARLRRRFAGAAESPPPPEIRRAIDLITALLRGEPSDLSGVHLDMQRVPAFERRGYEVARTIPAGPTVSYGGI